LALMTGANHKVGIARCLSCLGCLAHNQDELHQAEQFLQEALAIWQPITGQEAGMADVLRHLGQLLVSSGAHRHAEARQHFRQALELAIRYGLAPIALDVCVGVARLLAYHGNLIQAVELLTLAEQHEASTFETRAKARHQMAEMRDALSGAMAQTTTDQEQTPDLWGTVQALLARLTANAEAS
jgi:tetratricopeptide (TPR) repeat protein